MKLDSTLIIKNEEKNIKRLIEQLLLFSHEIHVTDTGSTDSTLDILNDLMKIHKNLYVHHFEWVYDFSKAKNYSLTCYDCKADYQFWCDADDTLNDTLLNTMLKFVKEEHDADIYYIRYKYFKEDTNPHWRTSILRTKKNCIWHDPIHEYINIDDTFILDFDYFNNDSLLIHHKEESHANRNVEIFFNMERTKHNFTCRNRYYYGQELRNTQLIELACIQFKKCIEHEDYNIADKINSCINLYTYDIADFKKYAFKILEQGVYRKDLFYYIGNYFYFIEKKYLAASLYYNMCLNCPIPNDLQDFQYDNSCVMNSHLQMNVIEYAAGNLNMAIEHNKKVLEIDPKNETALNNIKLIKKEMKKSK